jgi:teichoic acid transport system permease protein
MATIGAAPAPARVTGRTSYVRDLWGRRDFTIELAKGNLTARNAATRLGALWWLINPLLVSGVYFLVFGVIIKGTERSEAAFLAYLIVGVLVFRYLAQGLTSSAGLILSNAKLIVNLRFPRMVLPIAAVLESLIAFVASLGIFYVLVTPVSCLQAASNTGTTCIAPTYRLALLPVPVILLALFTLGIGALVARWVVPNRDVRNLIPHATRIWFYLSPVLWGVERLAAQPDWLVAIIKINPMYAMLSLFRTALINDPFEPLMLAAAAAWTVVILVVGVWVFIRNEDVMARYL